MDWVVYPQWRQDEHLIINSSDGGFQVDISARPIWLQNTTTPTNIVITAAINTDGTVAMSYLVTGPTYDNQTRTGVRLTDGSIVTLAEYGVTQVQSAPVLTAAPVETTTATSPSESQTSTVDTSTTTPSDTSTTTTDTSTSTVDTSTTVVDSSTGVVDSTTTQNTTSPSDATSSTDQAPQPVPPVSQEPVVIPRDPSTDQNTEEEPQPIDPEPEAPVDIPQEESETLPDDSPIEETDTQELPEQEQTDQLEESSPNTTVDEAVSEAMADGVLTEEEKDAVAEALIESADGEALSAEDIKEAGLTYDDLPPETPVDVRTDDKGNPVIIEAQVAAALVLLESPAALVGALFDDPGKALLAVASIGADMSPEEREESEKIVVAAVIAGQAAIGAAALAAQTTTTGGSSSSGSSGGGGASGESKGVGRRKP